MNRISTSLTCLIALSLLWNLVAAEPASKLPDASSAGPASFQIRNKKFGDLLRPENANNATGTPIVLYPAQPWKCMTWKLHPAGESGYQLQNHFTSKTFAADAKAEQSAAVTQVPFAKQQAERPVWHFTKLSDGTYEISDAKTGKALTAVKAANGLKIVVQAWRESPEQKWELIPIDPSQLTM